MRSKLIYFALLFTLFCCNTQAGIEQNKAKLDSYLVSLAANDKAMMGVAIRQHGELIYQNHQGMASIEDKAPLKSDTKFRIGSITKVFTAVMIMQLVESGQLSLDSKLSDYFPVVANADKITIAHLLGHRSGIYSFTDDDKYPRYMTKEKSAQQMVDIISDYQSVFSPGERYEYSNSNYVLLGLIIENLRKSSYATALEKHIVAPLKLHNTYYGNTIRLQDNEAFSYRYSDGNWVLAAETHMSIPHGAGAIVSTPADLTQFMDALFHNKLVSEASLGKMQEMKEGYGMGLMTFPFYEKRTFGHNGGIDGFVSNTAYIHEDELAIAVTANGVNFVFNDILIAVFSSVYDKPFNLPDFSARAIQISESEMTQRVGNYASSDLPLEIEISVDNGQLFAQATGQSKFPLTAFSNGAFRFEPAGIVIRFDDAADHNDKAGIFVLEQGGGKFRYQRQN